MQQPRPKLFRADEAGHSGYGYDRMEALDGLARSMGRIPLTPSLTPIFTADQLVGTDLILIEEIRHDTGQARSR